MRRSPAAVAILALVLLPGATSPARAQPVPAWEAFAIRYATVPRFPTSALIAGSDTSRRTDLAMMVWLLRGPGGRTVLVDAGFKREDLIARWKPVGYVRPDSAVARAGVKPSEVTDIIVSHIHWDHFDGVDLFPNARLWIQREEVEHHISATGAVLDRSIDGPDAAMLHALRAAGRVALVDGDAKEIIPGITVYTGGKHTYQSQYAAVRTAAGTVVIASDNAYLFENLERHVPIAQTLDATSNLAAQERMGTLASAPRLIAPGHDPLVFERFERVAPDVVRLVPRPPAGHDAYPRQPIDVEHYRFALRLADSTDRIVGDATVRLRILSPGLTTVTLDLASATPARQGRGMRVSAVSRHGHELRFSHANDRLAITLDSAAPAGEVIELAVHYDGIPADGLQVKPNKYADRSFFSDNWPDKARHWLPVIDHI